MSVSRLRSIYTLAAKSEGQVLAHCITRIWFLRYVIAQIHHRLSDERRRAHFGLYPLVVDSYHYGSRGRIAMHPFNPEANVRAGEEPWLWKWRISTSLR